MSQNNKWMAWTVAALIGASVPMAQPVSAQPKVAKDAKANVKQGAKDVRDEAKAKGKEVAEDAKAKGKDVVDGAKAKGKEAHDL
ncbi:MAG: hypothetical protein R3A47_01435 [Polyangiales bacterium]